MFTEIVDISYAQYLGYLLYDIAILTRRNLIFELPPSSFKIFQNVGVRRGKLVEKKEQNFKGQFLYLGKVYLDGNK